MNPTLALDPGLRRATVLAVTASALPLLPQLPGTALLGLLLIGGLAAWAGLRQPLPLALRLALVLLVLAAVLLGFGWRVGRDAGSALLVAMLLLKLAELRDLRDARRAVAYALFAPFTAFLQDQGPLVLLLGLMSSAVALVGLGRLARAPEPAAPLRAELTALGRAALFALPLALVGFWLFPRLGTPLWGLPENAVARTGISDSMAPGDWIDLLADDSTAFSVRFDGPMPAANALYWRGPVLDRFDGRRWTPDPALAEAPAPALPTGQTTPLRYTLTTEGTERRELFALDLPTQWPAEVRLGGDATLRSEAPLRAVARFALAATPHRPFEPTLPPARLAAYLALPEGFNPRTAERAREWRAEAASDAAYIERVLRWFNAEHAYDLAAPPLGRHTADEFLFDTRTGFCEHFSSAFVVLMRNAGIPARVVLGYVGGAENRIGGFWTVRQLDAHAWVEVWVEGRGWVRVDPTAAVAPERIFDTVDALDEAGDAGSGVGGTVRQVFEFGGALREAWNGLVAGYNAARQQDLLRGLGWGRGRAEDVATAFVVAAGIALAVTVLVLVRSGTRERDPLRRAWQAYLRRWARRGLAKSPHESALAFAARVAREAPHAAGPLQALAQRWSALHYAPGQDDAAARRALAGDLRGARVPALSRR